MAKTLKFNLICDGQPIKDLDGLRDNFETEDILENYNNQRLHKWLKSRGFDDEYERVCAIEVTEPIEQIRTLCEIFDVEFDEAAVSRIVEAVERKRQKAEREAKYAEGNIDADEILNDKFNEFDRLIDEMVADGTNEALIKQNVNIILDDYFDIFKHSTAYIFDKLFNEAPYAILRFMLYENSRPYFVPETNAFDNCDEVFKKKYRSSSYLYPTLSEITDILESHAKDKFMLNMNYERICNLLTNKDDFSKKLAPCLNNYKVVNDGKTKNIVPAGERCMFIKTVLTNKTNTDILNKTTDIKDINFKAITSFFVSGMTSILDKPEVCSAGDVGNSSVTRFAITDGLDVHAKDSDSDKDKLFEIWYIKE